MTSNLFWNLIEKIHRDSRGDMDKKCTLLETELRRLPLEEVVSFGAHFDAFHDRAYSWELWAAAYIINGGCSDDSFSDFRSTLISMGRQAYEAALADPESLAAIDYDDGEACYEGFEYAAILMDMGKGQTFPRAQPMPDEPSGTEWDEDELAELYPKLAEKHGFAG